MGKPLDGRSDVYALGVVAYEMITGRLPFPDAKGPAGLITAQLKQTPAPPSVANPKVLIPKAADRAILKCLEKDKNNRFADVSQLSVALQEVIAEQGAMTSNQSGERPHLPAPSPRGSPPEVLEARRADGPNVSSPAAQGAMLQAQAQSSTQPGAPGTGIKVGSPPPKLPLTPVPGSLPSPVPLPSPLPQTPVPQAPYNAGPNHVPVAGGPAPGSFPQPAPYPPPYLQQVGGRGSMTWVWWLVGLLVLGAGFGALVAVLVS
jgi:serine/threonine protein kinase